MQVYVCEGARRVFAVERRRRNLIFSHGDTWTIEEVESLSATDFELRNGPASVFLCIGDDCDAMRFISDRLDGESIELRLSMSMVLSLVKFITSSAQMFASMSAHGSMPFSMSYPGMISEFWYGCASIYFSRKYSKNRKSEKSNFLV
jgi:hypothetical protein